MFKIVKVNKGNTAKIQTKSKSYKLMSLNAGMKDQRDKRLQRTSEQLIKYSSTAQNNLISRPKVQKSLIGILIDRPNKYLKRMDGWKDWKMLVYSLFLVQCLT